MLDCTYRCVLCSSNEMIDCTHRTLDIEVMLGLHTKVNIIPVIAKVILISCTYDKHDFLCKRMLILKITNLFSGRHIYSSGKKAVQRKGR